MDFKIIRCGPVDWIQLDSGCIPVNDNEPSGSIKFREFIAQLSNYQSGNLRATPRKVYI
jgi:hypothetical protein